MTKLEQKIYESVKKIPHGKVATYKDIAIKLGNPNLSRIVGNALHKNIEKVIIPCHKVVNYNGNLANNFAFGGIKGQKELLELENIFTLNNKVNLLNYRFKF